MESGGLIRSLVDPTGTLSLVLLDLLNAADASVDDVVVVVVD